MKCFVVMNVEELHHPDCSIFGIYLSEDKMVEELKDALEGAVFEDEDRPFSEMSTEEFLEYLDGSPDNPLMWFQEEITE